MARSPSATSSSSRYPRNKPGVLRLRVALQRILVLSRQRGALVAFATSVNLVRMRQRAAAERACVRAYLAPMQKRWASPLRKILPPATAGEQELGSPRSFCAICSNAGPALITHDIPALA
jgi:hypothetical protein